MVASRLEDLMAPAGRVPAGPSPNRGREPLRFRDGLP